MCFFIETLKSWVYYQGLGSYLKEKEFFFSQNKCQLHFNNINHIYRKPLLDSASSDTQPV